MIVDYHRARRLAPRDAEAFGIIVDSPDAAIAVRRGRTGLSVTVGRLVLIGDSVRVVPRDGVEPRAMELLLGAAEQVWRFGREPEEGWHRLGAERWETDVEVRLDR